MCFSQAKSKWRGCFVGIFCLIFFFKTASAAALEWCKKMLLIPETVVYPWRKKLGEGGQYFFPRCTALQSRVKLIFFFLTIIIIIFLDLFDQLSFCLSLPPPPVSLTSLDWGAGNKAELCFLTSKEILKYEETVYFVLPADLDLQTRTRKAPAPRQGQESPSGATGQLARE